MIFLIYNKGLDEHLSHLRQLLIIPRDRYLFANLDKCTFCKDNVIFLGFKDGKDGAHVDLENIKAIQE